MNRWLYTVGITLMAGLALASFFLVSFNAGWILRELNETYYVPLLIFTLLLPLIVIIIASINDRIRLVMVLIMVGLFEACSYVVVTTLDNAGMNTSYKFYFGTISAYSLMLGSALTFMMLSMAELGRISRAVESWPMLACVALAMPGLLMAASLAAGLFGWVQNVLLAMMLQPTGLLVQLLVTPQRPDPDLQALDRPDQLRSAHVVDPLKGGILALFMLLTGANVGLLVGLNGMGLDVLFFQQENYIFYASIGIGAVGGTGITAYSARRVLLVRGSSEKNRDAKVFLLAVMQLQFVIWLAAVIAGVFVPDMHGSTTAQVVDGMAVGIILSLYLAAMLVYHPPRLFTAYVMLVWYCAGAFYVVGQMLKAIAFGSEGFESVQEYVPWALFLEVIVIAVIVLLLIVPRQRDRDVPLSESPISDNPPSKVNPS